MFLKVGTNPRLVSLKDAYPFPPSSISSIYLILFKGTTCKTNCMLIPLMVKRFRLGSLIRKVHLNWTMKSRSIE
ncbi:MAG TPA: hypothetical protein VFF27_00465 [Bacteroidia bacterium]|nr:hypothetical protein [Bacteroidia bacterium]